MRKKAEDVSMVKIRANIVLLEQNVKSKRVIEILTRKIGRL